MTGTKPLSEPRSPTQQLMVQIDGLSRPVLERALEQRRMPTVHQMIEGDSTHELISMYSGLPSTTPAVQGELFYGVATAVPGFAFLDRRHQKVQHMLEPQGAAGVEQNLAASGNHALLAGGASFSNIYVAGARDARFSAAGLSAVDDEHSGRRWNQRLRDVVAVFGLLWRSGLMLIAETSRQLIHRRLRINRGIGGRLAESFGRIAGTIVLRDRARLAAVRAIRRGVPMVHVNFVGYDKQAHRYGPDSRAAMRTLGAIDRCIETLTNALRMREGVRGTAVVYSDHGQESTLPMQRRDGRGIEDVVHELMRDIENEVDCDSDQRDIEIGRRKDDQLRASPSHERSISSRLGERVLGIDSSLSSDRDNGRRSAVTVESGPIAHVYLMSRRHSDVRSTLSWRITSTVPGIAALWKCDDTGNVRAVIGDRCFDDLKELCELLQCSHPFASMVAEDLQALVNHEDSGEIVLLATGFQDHGLTFADEYGSHGGPGALETHAFAVVPREWNVRPAARGGDGGPRFVRPMDLRELVLRERDRS